MTIVAHKRNAKTGSSRLQQVTKEAPTVNHGPRSHHGIHEFRWIETKSGNTAICTCGRWELYGTRPGALTKESAKRNHALHLGMVTDRAVGHEGALQDEAPRQTNQIPLEGQFSTKKGGSRNAAVQRDTEMALDRRGGSVHRRHTWARFGHFGSQWRTSRRPVQAHFGADRH